MPQSTAGKPPARLMCGRKLRSTLHLTSKIRMDEIQTKQVKQKFYHDCYAKERHLDEGDQVYTRDVSLGPTWIPGNVQKRQDQCCAQWLLEMVR